MKKSELAKIERKLESAKESLAFVKACGKPTEQELAYWQGLVDEFSAQLA